MISDAELCADLYERLVLIEDERERLFMEYRRKIILDNRLTMLNALISNLEKQEAL